jgi:putative endonuclease
MFYVYLLRDVNGKNYIGYSKDLRRRLKEHLSHKVYTTRRMASPKLIYYEAYLNEKAAQEREIKLKQFGSSYHGLIKRLNIGV